MAEPKIALDLSGLSVPFVASLRAAAQLGAVAIEFDVRGDIAREPLSQTAIRQIRKLLDDHRLRVSAVRFRTRRGYNVEAELDARIEATKRAMQLAHALGAGLVLNAVGRLSSDAESPDWKLLVEVLGDLAAHGHRVGGMLAIETGGESGADLARLIAALPAGAVGIDFQPANLILGGYSPREALTALGPHIMAVHLADARFDSVTGNDLVPLGQGDADVPELLGALDLIGYRGYLTLKPSGAGDVVAELADAMRFLRRL